MWLYLPSKITSSSAPEPAPPVELSTDFSAALAASCTWRGKPTLPLYWRLVWRRKTWMRRLSGVTLSPSTAARGVESWISSLQASRASRTASPASAKAPTTRGGSGRISLGSFATWDRRSSSWRTCQGSLLPGDSASFSGTWPHSGTLSNGTCLARQKSARPTSAGASSSWPTPTSMDGYSGPGHGETMEGSASLRTVAWPTATVQNSPRGTTTTGISHPGVSLIDAVRMFPTPKASQYGSSQNGINSTRPSAGTPSLDTMAARGLLPSRPPPGDADGWRRFLANDPSLEPSICRDSDGVAPGNDGTVRLQRGEINGQVGGQESGSAGVSTDGTVREMRIDETSAATPSRSRTASRRQDVVPEVPRGRRQGAWQMGEADDVENEAMHDLRQGIQAEKSDAEAVRTRRVPHGDGQDQRGAPVACTHDRLDRLRLCGNGIVDLQLELAVRSLWRRAVIGR